MFVVAILFYGYSTIFAQVLQAPQLVDNGQKYNRMCKRNPTDLYPINFTFTEVFDNNNVFYVEISDAEGSFEKAKRLQTITGQNDYYYIETSIELPDDTYGENYKLRIISTSPAMEGEVSEPFEAYNIANVDRPILNKGQHVVICGDGAATISLNRTDIKYIWYRNDVQIDDVSGSSLEVTREGEYYAKPDYGSCISLKSNVINVTVIPGTGNLRIEGNDKIAICQQDTHTFTASTTDATAFDFVWYLNDEIIQGANKVSYTTTGTPEQFGTYKVKTIPKAGGNCRGESQEVELSRLGDSFVTKLTFDNQVLLDNQDVILNVEVPTAKPSVSWYKDGVVIYEDVRITRISVNEPGIYSAKIIDETAACPFEVSTNEVVVVEANNIKPIISINQDYQECVSDSVTVSLEKVVTEVEGKEYELSNQQMEQLVFSWRENGNPLSVDNPLEVVEGALKINSYKSNANYSINVKTGELIGESNEVAVALKIGEAELQSSSPSNAICPSDDNTDNKITLIVSPELKNVTYVWKKDEVVIVGQNLSTIEVNEKGSYKCIIDANGCETILELEIKEFDESIISFSPENVIINGDIQQVMASGADEYSWFDSKGNLLSSTEEVAIKEEDIYTLKATVGNCTVEKQLIAKLNDGKIIVQNIISPTNVDGVNDFWKLPNRFTTKDVRVIIYDTRGKELLNTVEYKGNWPENVDDTAEGMIFYYKIIKQNQEIKTGTISVLN